MGVEKLFYKHLSKHLAQPGSGPLGWYTMVSWLHTINQLKGFFYTATTLYLEVCGKPTESDELRDDQLSRFD